MTIVVGGHLFLRLGFPFCFIDINCSAMADGGMLLIFRGQPTDVLLDLQNSMMDQLTSMKDYTSMTAGGKSFTRDFRQLMGQLEAIQFVLNERGSGGKVGYDSVGVVDFTERGKAPPAGTSQPLTY